jgi:hypothetical protein
MLEWPYLRAEANKAAAGAALSPAQQESGS